MNIVDLIKPKKYSEIKVGDMIMFEKDVHYSIKAMMLYGNKPYKVVEIEKCSDLHPESPNKCEQCTSNGYIIYIIDEEGFKSTQCTTRLRNKYGMYLQEG